MLKQELETFFGAIRFFTRLPVPAWVGHSSESLQKSSRYMPLIGVIVGALVSLVPPLATGNMALAPISGASAMLCGLIVVPVVSLLTKKHGFSKEHLEAMFGDAEPVAPQA